MTLWLLRSQIRCRWCSHRMRSILSPPSSRTATSTFLQDHTPHTSHQMSTPNKVRDPAFLGLSQKVRSHISLGQCLYRCLCSVSLCGSKHLCRRWVINLIGIFYSPQEFVVASLIFQDFKKEEEKHKRIIFKVTAFKI